ncbi:hypothetical protein ACJW30_03G177600 [Castanea mollissima]
MPSTNTTKTNKNLPSYCYSFSNTNTKQFINKFFCSVRDCSHIFTHAKPFGFERKRELLQSGTTQGRNLLSARPKFMRVTSALASRGYFCGPGTDLLLLLLLYRLVSSLTLTLISVLLCK